MNLSTKHRFGRTVWTKPEFWNNVS